MSTSETAVIYLILIGVTLPFVLPIMLVFSIYWRAWRNGRGFKSLCNALGARLGAHKNIAHLTLGEHSIRLLWASESSRYTFSSFVYAHDHPLDKERDQFVFPPVTLTRGGIVVLLMECDLPVSFAFSRETTFDALAKRSGLAREHQTADTSFDKEVYISCEDKGFLQGYLTPERRKLIFTLLQNGFQQIFYSRKAKQLALCSDGSFLRSHIDAASAQQLTREYLSLVPTEAASSREHKAFVSEPHQISDVDQKERNAWVAKEAAICIVALILVYFYGGLFGSGLVSWMGFISAVAAVSLGVFVLLAAKEWRRVQGTSTGHQKLIATMLKNAIAVPLATYLVLSTANRYLDLAAAREVSGTFDGVREHHGRRRIWNYYTADLSLPMPSGKVVRVELYTARDRLEELRGRSGRPVIIWVKPGLLGFEYVADFEFR